MGMVLKDQVVVERWEQLGRNNFDYLRLGGWVIIVAYGKWRRIREE